MCSINAFWYLLMLMETARAGSHAGQFASPGWRRSATQKILANMRPTAASRKPLFWTGPSHCNINQYKQITSNYLDVSRLIVEVVTSNCGLLDVFEAFISDFISMAAGIDWAYPVLVGDLFLNWLGRWAAEVLTAPPRPLPKMAWRVFRGFPQSWVSGKVIGYPAFFRGIILSFCIQLIWLLRFGMVWRCVPKCRPFLRFGMGEPLGTSWLSWQPRPEAYPSGVLLVSSWSAGAKGALGPWYFTRLRSKLSRTLGRWCSGNIRKACALIFDLMNVVSKRYGYRL